MIDAYHNMKVLNFFICFLCELDNCYQSLVNIIFGINFKGQSKNKVNEVTFN